jgi:hypothetical protein
MTRKTKQTTPSGLRTFRGERADIDYHTESERRDKGNSDFDKADRDNVEDGEEKLKRTQRRERGRKTDRGWGNKRLRPQMQAHLAEASARWLSAGGAVRHL